MGESLGMTSQRDTEVIVIGAGLTGATLACGLAAQGIDLSLIHI